MNNTNAVTITGSGKIAAIINGKSYTANPDHPNYDSLLASARKMDWNKFVEHFDIASKISAYISDEVQLKDGIIFYQGEVLDNTLTKRLINLMSNKLPFAPMLKFLNNLLQNPSKRAVDELYSFLDVGELPITEDGCFLAFKNVKSDYKDIHSGTFDNSVGKVCEMLRNKVDEDKDRTCSYGLHFCSIAYLPHFSDSNGGHTMIVKINPKDVVAIPSDYNNTKGRTCRYEVVGEYTDDWRSKLDRGENGFDSPLYDEDGNEYEDDEQVCDNCGTTLDNYDEQGELCNSCANEHQEQVTICCSKCESITNILYAGLCETCYDDEYSGVQGGGCAGRTTLDDEEIPAQDESEVGNEGRDGCCGGSCDCHSHQTPSNDNDLKQSGAKYHNVRDALGRFFSKKNK